MAEEKALQLAPGIDITNVLVIILYLVLIVAAAYFLTKYVAKRSLQKGMKPRAGTGRANAQRRELGHMVSVADRIAIDRDKTIVVVEFQGKYYLMGTSPQGFEQIDKVDIPEDEAQPPEEADEAGPARKAGPHATPGEGAEERGTFWERFKKCFSIVLKSYLPGGNRKKDVSFSEQLKKESKKEDHKPGEDQ